jgi:lipoprotein-anchoring transpeptidase ErfK/SrfK
MKKCLLLLVLCGAMGLFSSCSSTGDYPSKRGEKVNRLADGRVGQTYQDFLNRDDYRVTRDVWYNDERIRNTKVSNSRIDVNLGVQRAQLYVNDQIAMDFPVCTGKSTHKTPRGSFKIVEKVRDYRSHSYGSVYDASGKCVNSDATPASAIPAGGKFVGAEMPMWMRIHGGVGLHVGRVYRDADSHGCIRVPIEPCTRLWDNCGVGTRVVVKD